MTGTLAQTIGKGEGWKYTPLHGVTLPENGFRSVPMFDNSGDQYVWERIKNIGSLVVPSGKILILIDDVSPNFGLPQTEGSSIEIERGASMVHVRLYNEIHDKYFGLTHVRVHGDGNYTHVALSRGSALMRLPIQVELMDNNARCDLRGVHMVSGENHVDQAVVIKHMAPHCLSNQTFRYVVSDEAQATFQGKIHVARDAQKTQAYQMCKSLLLSEGAQVNTKPELEIYADDVKCSHGATTGALDERALFYMQSRGIPRAEAQSLLMHAFLDEVFEGLDLTDDVHEKIQAFLG